MQVQAPPPYAPLTFAPASGASATGLFNAFYEATSPIAFDFAAGLTPQPHDVAAIVSSAYDDCARSHAVTGEPYHVVPLLSRVYAAATAYPRPPMSASRPGVGAIDALGEPHRSVLVLMERHKFPAESTAAILGLTAAEVVDAHEDARAVAHGVSAALALCPNGVPACPALAAELDPGAGVVAQTERILGHAERCNSCLPIALASPDPIRELRGALTPVTAPSITSGPGPVAYAGAAAVPAAAAAVWSAAPAGASPLPGPAPGPTLTSKVPHKDGGWAPLRLWSKASGWQKSGAVMAVLLITALVVAIVAGGDGEDVAARTTGSTTSSGSGPNGTAPIPTIPATVPPTTTTEPITTAPGGVVETQPPTTYSASGSSGSSSGFSGSTSSASSSQSPQETSPPQTAPDTTAPPTTAAPAPKVTSYTWGASSYPKPPTNPPTRDVDFNFVSTGTSVTYTTSWGTSGNLLAGEGTIPLKAVPIGNQSILLTINGPGGTATASFQAPWL